MLCKTPRRYRDYRGEWASGPCRKCDECRKMAKNTFVGQVLAEADGREADVCTLTYRGDVSDAVSLQTRKVQMELKRIRHEFPVRYFIAGEYGSLRQRAHWHAVFVWQKKRPTIRKSGEERAPWEIVYPRFKNDPAARIEWAGWRHGYSFFQPLNYQTAQYALEYTMKDVKSRSGHTRKMQSKYPPLGDAYFRRLAKRYCDANLLPEDWTYTVPGVKMSNGRPRKFWLGSVSRENFMWYLHAEYMEAGKPIPFTEWYAEQIRKKSVSIENRQAEENSARKIRRIETLALVDHGKKEKEIGSSFCKACRRPVGWRRDLGCFLDSGVCIRNDQTPSETAA